MEHEEKVSRHYARGDLLDAILAGMTELGKSPDTVTIDDLAPVDEFHIGGRRASRDFLTQLEIAPDHHVLDVGCGIGGASRFTAHEFGCRVTGTDLTSEYIETGTTLCDWVGLSSSVRLVQGNALNLAFPDATFDRAFMLHVGMNIPDKLTLGREVWRVVKSRSLFGIYDIMRTGEGSIDFPVPWATDQEGSSLGSAVEYKQALEAAGFEIVRERNRREFALEFFADLKAKGAAADAPPPLGLQLIMGAEAPTKFRNMVTNVERGTIAPVEIIARKL